MTLIELLLLILVIWLNAWLANIISDSLEINLFMSSAIAAGFFVIFLYVFYAFLGLLSKSTESDKDDPTGQE